jgi:hypothetical protein
MLLGIGGARMKLFVSVLILAAASAALGQNQTGSQDQATLAKAQAAVQAQMQSLTDKMTQAGCPLFLQSASVAPTAGLLPVGMRTSGDGALNLHFRNQSGKAIQSASITAHLRIKTNVYALDAHPVDLRLSLNGTDELNKAVDQLTRITLPDHVYLFGVATVSLDQVTFDDGSVWTAKAGANACAVGAPGTELLEAK